MVSKQQQSFAELLSLSTLFRSCTKGHELKQYLKVNVLAVEDSCSFSPQFCLVVHFPPFYKSTTGQLYCPLRK